MMKKEWTKPEVVVLVRGSVEENVLNACKSSPQSPACFNESGWSREPSNS